MIKDIRKNYELFQLDAKNLPDRPFDLFKTWLQEAIESGQEEPTAMTLSTFADGRPDARIVLLKDMSNDGLSFFTNYNSAKGRQIQQNPEVALTFFWSRLERQVRINGTAEKLSAEQSADYFRSRPRESQLGAWASDQSQVVSDRNALEERYARFEKLYEGQEIAKPAHWGGYVVVPSRIEFWQGRSGRLHDRILYSLENEVWTQSRLAP